MYYAAWDKQCGKYFHTGRNARSPIDCIKDICEYLIEGAGLDVDDQENWKNMDTSDILNHFEVEIHKSSTQFGDHSKDGITVV